MRVHSYFTNKLCYRGVSYFTILFSINKNFVNLSDTHNTIYMPKSRSNGRTSKAMQRSRTARSKRSRSSMVKRKNKSRRPMVRLPQPHKGLLTQFGYHNVKFLPEMQRRRKLRRAILELGDVPVIRHLTLVANFSHRSDPAAYAIFKRDQEWVSQQYKKQK